MAICLGCGKKLGLLERGNEGRCFDCYMKHLQEKKDAPTRKTGDELALYAVQNHEAIDAILLTTETAPDLKITKRIEIVTAEVAYGMHFFKDMFAGVRDLVGGRSEAVQKTMRDARRTALYELKREAHSVGANAVVAVDLDYVDLSTGGNMVMLVASGTAVVIE